MILRFSRQKIKKKIMNLKIKIIQAKSLTTEISQMNIFKIPKILRRMLTTNVLVIK